MKIKISINKTASSRLGTIDFNNLPFGKIFTDHMFVADFYDNAWQDFRIVPFESLHLHPATSALHYGQAIFEGLKASPDIDGNPLLFRPWDNGKRLAISAERMAMPEFPQEVFLRALDTWLDLEREWVPNVDGTSLYIRPYMFATDNYIGIKPADNFKFVIFGCPVGAYYPKPVKVYISEKYVRAFPGGVGFAKAAGNYAATLQPVSEVKRKGYDQILWLDAYERKYFQEIGTMNIFFLINDTLITPELSEGTILSGITRDSIIKLAKHSGINVDERKISVKEVLEAYDQKKLQDVFGTGTAATVSHISHIGFRDDELELPPITSRELSTKLKSTLEQIKRGLHEDIFSWIRQVPKPEIEENELTL